MSSGRIVGILLLVGALVVCLLGAALVLPRAFTQELTVSAAVLGIVLALIIALPLAAGGVFMIVRGGQEAKTDVVAQKQRRLLDMVTTRGQVTISDAAVEMQVPRDEVKKRRRK